MEKITSVACASLDNMHVKTCTKCLETVKVHVTCFKCNRIYHPRCLIKASTSYVTEMGQVFCCQNLTPQYNIFETETGSQENKNESFKEEDVCVSDDGLECNGLEQEEYKNAENTCDMHFKKENTLESQENKNESLKEEEVWVSDVTGLEYSGPEQEDYKKAENTCDTSFKKENTLDELNEDKDDFVCSFCKIKFFEKKPYSQHIQWCNKLFKCNDCSYTTHKNIYLREHMFNHLGLKPYKCGTCEFATVSKRGLDQHVAFKHSCPPKINVVCSLCKMKFLEEKAYKRHLKRCGKNNLRLKTTQDAAISSKLYKCEKCSYSSRWLYQVKKHLAIHSREKLFQCTFKDCTCTQPPDSSQEKDCDCSVCEYRTSNKQYLSRHMLQHNQMEKFECYECAYTCYTKTVLRKHLLFRHRKIIPLE